MRNRVLLLVSVVFVACNTYAQWIYQDTLHNTITFHSVKFLSPTNGWTVGDKGTIMNYDGSKWSLKNSGTTSIIWDLNFLDALNGWAITDNNIMLKYNLTTWKRDTTIQSSYPLESISFLDNSHGWAVGIFGTIYMYDGTSWISQKSGVQSTLTSVYFVDEAHGWAVGWGGVILFYNGTKWVSQFAGTSANLYSVYFVDAYHGWAVGDNGTILSYNGIKWQQVNSETNNWLRSVYFTDATHGWAVGEKGTVLRYNGINWTTIPTPTSSMLLSVFFVDTLKGWAVGENGRIMYNENGGLEDVKELEIRNDELGINISPNPVNELSVISYQLSVSSNVTIKIFDNIGREIKTLVNEKKPKGQYEIKYNTRSLLEGIYFCQIISGNKTLTKKFLKID